MKKSIFKYIHNLINQFLSNMFYILDGLVLAHLNIEFGNIYTYHRKNNIDFAFAHGLTHIFTGITHINNFEKEIKKFKLDVNILIDSWIYHDSGRIQSLKNDLDYHSQLSLKIYNNIKKENSNPIIENIIKYHTFLDTDSDNIDAYTAIIVLIDIISLVNLGIFNSTLDRIILTKIEDVLTKKNHPKGFGKKESSATKMLLSRLDEYTNIILTIQEKFPELGRLTNKAQSTINNIKKTYLDKKLLFIYILLKLNFNIVQVFIKHKRILDLLVEQLIQQEIQRNKYLLTYIGHRDKINKINQKLIQLKENDFSNIQFNKIKNAIYQ